MPSGCFRRVCLSRKFDNLPNETHLMLGPPHCDGSSKDDGVLPITVHVAQLCANGGHTVAERGSISNVITASYCSDRSFISRR